MAIVYPLSPSWSYPVTRTLTFKTQLVTHEDGSEQRWPLASGEERWTLPYNRLSLSDRNTLLDFLESCKGAYAGDVSFTFNGVTYTGLHLDSDRMSAAEATVGARSVSVVLVQAVRPADTGELAADFPLLASGARVQFPYTHERGFLTDAVATDGGRYANARRASSLRTWSVSGPVLSDSEAQAIWDMFSRARGRHAEFAFTDPDDATRYASCRFASDTLEWRYTERGINSIQTQIQQLP